jgi:hypothetical protein
MKTPPPNTFLPPAALGFPVIQSPVMPLGGGAMGAAFSPAEAVKPAAAV